MNDVEFADFTCRLALRFPDVPVAWVSTVITTAADLILRSGRTPTPREVEVLADQCLRLKTAVG